MNIVQSWKDSLLLLLPQNFKLFALVTLKSIMDTYKTLFKYWWFLYGSVIGFYGLIVAGIFGLYKYKWYLPITDMLQLMISIIIMEFFFVLFFIIQAIFLFIVCLTTRSSIKQKNYAYYLNYLKQYWYCLFLAMAALYIKVPLLYSLLIIFLLFIVDAQPSLNNMIYALINSMRFMLYNFPLFIILELFIELAERLIIFINYYLLSGVFQVSHAIIFALFATLLVSIITLLFSPILIVILTNLYIKRVHDQPELYFPTPK